VFTQWILAVHGEVEDALATRSIPVTTQETGNPDVPVTNPEKTRVGKEIYDQMWIWYLDSIDQISHDFEAKRSLDFTAKTLLSSLITRGEEKDTYISVGKENEEEKLPKTDESVLGVPIYKRNNFDDSIDKVTKSTKYTLDELRKTVADSILSTYSPKQIEIIKAAAGRNVELMNNCFQITNILGINIDDSIKKPFVIKHEVEEEEREVGLTGYLRDFLVDMYKKRRHKKKLLDFPSTRRLLYDK
jgi:hypothetical protein